MAMNCSELEQEWEQRFADCLAGEGISDSQRRPWSVDAEAHFAVCVGCRQRLQAEALLDQALVVWRGQDLPAVSVPSAEEWLRNTAIPGMPVEVMQGPRSEALRTRSRSKWSPSVMVAASCLACVAAGWLLMPSGPEVSFQVSTPATPEESAVTDSLALMLSDVRVHSEAAARSTVASLDRWPASVAVAASSHPLAVPSIPPQRPADGSEAPPQQNWSRWGSPLGQQVGGAFQFLNEVLPEMAGPAG